MRSGRTVPIRNMPMKEHIHKILSVVAGVALVICIRVDSMSLLRSRSQQEYRIPVQVKDGYSTVQEDGVSFTFRTSDYGYIVMTKKEKFVTSEPSPIGSYPEYRCIHLEDKRP